LQAARFFYTPEVHATCVSINPPKLSRL
jgi:hypothetical protein